MGKALVGAWGWLLSAVAIFGLLFGGISYLTDPKSLLVVGWFYLLASTALCILVWLFGALWNNLQQRSPFSAIEGIFSPTDDFVNDMYFLLRANENYGSRIKCSIYIIREKIEVHLGSAFVSHIQEDGRIQLKVLLREDGCRGTWERIENNDKGVIDRVRVKVGDREL